MPTRKPNYEVARLKAIGLQTAYDLDGPPVPVFRIAAGEGLQVILASFSAPSVSGLIDIAGKRMLISSDESVQRQAFTAAHELGHWMLHRDKVQEDPNRFILYRGQQLDGEKDPIEQEANAFAAELLVPLRWLRDYSHLPPSEIASVFGVSKDVIGYRLPWL